jgi:flagellar P-ring protein precursor FlgI
MRTTRRWPAALALGAAALYLLLPLTASAARIRDLAQLDGVRDNQLLGFGLVGGLAGTGDDPKNAPFTAEAIANMLATFGFQLQPQQVNVKNFAAVMVTATLPAYLANGDHLDVTVSSIGTAKSLAGGMLYQALLRGPDGEIYAVAQGPVSLGSTIGGAGAGGGGGGQAKQIETVGRIPGGALVENTVPSTVLKPGGTIVFNINRPDFATATAVAAAINKHFGMPLAQARDAGSVRVIVPEKLQGDLVPLIAALQDLDAASGEPARVVINQRTGTVVIGQRVTILPVAVTHGSMTLTFGEKLNEAGTKPPETKPATEAAAPAATTPAAPTATPPAVPVGGATAPTAPTTAPAASGGTTAALLEEERWKLAPTTAEQVATGLNRLKLKPQDVVAIFEAIAASGALLGELVIL